MTRRKKRRRNLKGQILSFCAAIAFLAAIALFAIYLRSYIDDRMILKDQDELRDMFESGAPKQTSFLFPTAYAEEAEPERPVAERFTELYRINPDVIGWIIAGNEVSTPVVYRDNTYYMDHDFYGKQSAEGTVFADELNADWENDPYLILYGHNMKNGSMFGNMDHYMELDYFKANSTIALYSLYSDEPTYYVPFAAVDASVAKEHDSYFFLRRFSVFEPWVLSDDERENTLTPEEIAAVDESIAEIRARSMYAVPEIEVDSTDRILALVTCSYELPDARFTLFCRALREGETPESVAAIVQNATPQN